MTQAHAPPPLPLSLYAGLGHIVVGDIDPVPFPFQEFKTYLVVEARAILVDSTRCQGQN